MRRALIPVLAALALLAAAAPAQAQSGSLAGCHSGGGDEVCFNDPTGGFAQKAVLFKRLRELIDSAGEGDQINVAMYSWSGKGRQVTKALVEARQRRASVAVVADSGSREWKELKVLRRGGVDVKVCKYSCTSHDTKDSSQHAKLFLLRLDGHKHTVVTTGNLTGRQRDELSNDLVHSYADDELYDYYLEYWNRLYVRDWRGWGDADRVRRTSRGKVAMVFERTDRDPVVSILRGIRACTPEHGKVWVAASLFSRTEVRDRLTRLRRKFSCDLRVVLGHEVEADFAQELPRKRVRRSAIHHKMLIIDAVMAGGRIRQVVYTGSHNFTYNALVRNDEIWTGYANPFVFNTYAGYFDRLYARADR